MRVAPSCAVARTPRHVYDLPGSRIHRKRVICKWLRQTIRRRYAITQAASGGGTSSIDL